VDEEELRALLGSTDRAVVELLPQGNGSTCELCEFLPPEPDGTPLREGRLRIHALLNDFDVCGEHAQLALGLLRPRPVSNTSENPKCVSAREPVE
jgi:hypothetical protein